MKKIKKCRKMGENHEDFPCVSNVPCHLLVLLSALCYFHDFLHIFPHFLGFFTFFMIFHDFWHFLSFFIFFTIFHHFHDFLHIFLHFLVFFTFFMIFHDFWHFLAFWALPNNDRNFAKSSLSSKLGKIQQKKM